MNYLETGLPHTDFCRRKTDFSPPRYIPLCGGLGRKYLGLEPLSRREMGVLIKRLSEPKKSTDGEEQITLLTHQAGRRTAPATGRFVGQKKMSSFEIEKMVDRLYSRRTTKDYAFVDETVEADDILNMTNGLDGESDSEDDDEEIKVVKNRENSLLRRQSSVNGNTEQERKRSPIIRRESMSTNVNERSRSGRIRILPEVKESRALPEVKESRVLSEVKEPTENQVLKIDNKPRFSVSFQRPKSLIDSRRKINETHHNIDKNVVRTSECSNLPKPENKSNSPLPPGLRRCKSEIANSEKVDERRNSNTFISALQFPKSFTAELTRPSPTTIDFLLDGVGDTPRSAAEAKCDITTAEQLEKKGENGRSSKKSDSPRQKLSKTDEGKPVRYTAAPCDELLIDRVATYNRSSKLRCK